MLMSGLNGQFNARLQRLEKKAEMEDPKPTLADAGKVVIVNQDGDGYALAEKSVKYYPLVVESIGNPYTHGSTELPILSHPDHLDIVNFVRSGGVAYIALYFGSLSASSIFYIPVLITIDSPTNKSFTAEVTLHYGNNQAPTTVLQTYRVTCNNGNWASRYWNVKISATDYTS